MPSIARHHASAHVTSECNEPHHIGVEHGCNVVKVVFVYRGSAQSEAGVVDEDVDVAKACWQSVHEVFDRAQVLHVQLRNMHNSLLGVGMGWW